MICFVVSGRCEEHRTVWDLDDREAAAVLVELAREGDLASPFHAEAWVVIAALAHEIGISHCRFPARLPTFITLPSRASLSDEAIEALYVQAVRDLRIAQGSSPHIIDALRPISRQASRSLMSSRGLWDCHEVAAIWRIAEFHGGLGRRRLR